MKKANSFQIYLFVVSVVFFSVAAIHIVMGLNADEMLGANVSAQSMADPTLDSQNRFFGAMVAFYGAMTMLAATDLKRYKPALKLLLLFVFLAGGARLISVGLYGWPSMWVKLLLASELILPPLTYIWLSRLNLDKN